MLQSSVHEARIDHSIRTHMGGCQKYGPFLDPYSNTAPNIQGTPKRDHNFDNHP